MHTLFAYSVDLPLSSRSVRFGSGIYSFDSKSLSHRVGTDVSFGYRSLCWSEYNGGGVMACVDTDVKVVSGSVTYPTSHHSRPVVKRGLEPKFRFFWGTLRGPRGKSLRRPGSPWVVSSSQQVAGISNSPPVFLVWERRRGVIEDLSVFELTVISVRHRLNGGNRVKSRKS